MLMVNEGGFKDAKLYVEDVFSAFPYVGNLTARSIVNGIDLAGKGGLAWIKRRDAVADNYLYDSARANFYDGLVSNTTAASSPSGQITGANADGFSLAAANATNASGASFISWTFRKARKFFDVVTYVGNNNNPRSIPHDLGIAPGMLIVKAISTTGDWWVKHRSATSTHALRLNDNGASTTSILFASTEPTDSVFTVSSLLNTSGVTYVAYLFAHDDSEDGIIQCGSYTGNGVVANKQIDLGWEPQFVMVKPAAGGTGNWFMCDTSRGLDLGNDKLLAANGNFSESDLGTAGGIEPNSNGFRLHTASNNFNGSGYTYVYMAIRKGLMRPPTDASKVFDVVARTGNGSTAVITTPGIKTGPDLVITKSRNAANTGNWQDRLRGVALQLSSDSTGAEGAGTTMVTAFNTDGVNLGSQLRVNANGTTYINYFFKQAAGFFDIVTWRGANGGATPVVLKHALRAEPELFIAKVRGNARNWYVWYGVADKCMILNATSAEAAMTPFTSVSDTQINIPFPQSEFNENGENYVGYLFASCPGVSKIGTYTGTGVAQNIDCGFAAGARFVMIKRLDNIGGWIIIDSVRGLNAGIDPYLSLNAAETENSGNDYVSPFAGGFGVTTAGATNANGATYLYLAIA